MIRQAAAGDLETLTDLALLLWPGHAREALSEELSALLTREDAAFFLLSEGGAPAGFAQCGLRRDYVEGTHTSPVGYLEGIFVEEPSRKQGVAKELLRRAEAWAKEKGCSEFASDCELGNTESLSFHQSVGFREANRIICFTKQL